MELFETLFGIVKYGFFGLFGLLGFVVVMAVLFGKRVDKKWEYEANFRDARRREIGEFDIELSRIIEGEKAATQPDYTLKAKFELRHPSLTVGKGVRVRLVDTIAFDATVSVEGRIRLREEDLRGEIKAPEAGQMVTVEVGGAELFSEPLVVDH